MSSKDTEKNFVGQPNFKQLIDLLPKGKFDTLAIEHRPTVITRHFQHGHNL